MNYRVSYRAANAATTAHSGATFPISTRYNKLLETQLNQTKQTTEASSTRYKTAYSEAHPLVT
jgi:hypothetical protein